MKKRAMALALSVAMVLSSVPLSVSAEEPEVSVEVVEAEAEANEAQESGEAEVSEEPVEAEEIVAEPQIAVESMEEVPEAAAVEAEPEEVIAPVDNPVATATNITEMKIQIGSSSLIPLATTNQTQAGALDLTGNTPGNPVLSIPYDPTKTKMGEVLESLDLGTKGKNELTVSYEGNPLAAGTQYSLTLAGDYDKTKNAGPAYLCINFGSPYDDLKTVYVKFNIEPKSVKGFTAANNVSYDLTDVIAESTFEYNGKPIEFPITAVTDTVEDEVTKATTKVELKKAETEQTSGNYYMVKYVSTDLTNVGTKKITIKGTGNYAEDFLVEYKIAQKKYKEGDISIPQEVEFTAHESNDATLKTMIKDMVGGTAKDMNAADLKVVYYELDDKGAEKTTTPVSLPAPGNVKKATKYHYYVSLTGNGNFQAADTGLMGTITLKPAAATLEEVYTAMVAAKVLTTEYPYTGVDQMLANEDKTDIPSTIEKEFKDYIAKYNPSFANTVSVEAGKDAEGKKNVVAKNAGRYSVTVVTKDDEDKVIETKVIVVNVTPKSLTKADGTLDTATFTTPTVTQGINYDGTFTGNDPVLDEGVFKLKNVEEGSDLVKEFVEDKAYTVSSSTPDPTTGKVAKVTITGKDNYEGSITVDVTYAKKVDLRKLKEGAKVKLEADGTIKDANSIEIYDKAGTRIPVKSDNGFIEYTIKSEDDCAIKSQDNPVSKKHVMAAKTHTVTVAASANGKCTGELTIEFTFDGTSFAETYMADNRSVENPTVNTQIKTIGEQGQNVTEKAPHEAVMVKAQSGKNVKSLLEFDDNEANSDYTFSYVWADDPETDATKRLTISSKEFKDGGKKYNKKDGTEVTTKARTFPETGTWNLVMKPTTKLENGSLSGELVMQFEVEPKQFVARKNGQTTGGILAEPLKSVTWMGGKAVPADELAKAEVLSVKDGSTTLEYKKDFEVAAVTGNDKAGGKATVTLRGINNYKNDTINVEVTIDKRSLKDAKIKVNGGYQGGESLKILPEDVVVSFESNHEGNVPSDAYTVSDPVITNGKNFGLNSKAKVTITAAADSNYTGAADAEFTITKADIGTAAFEILVDKVYFFEGEKIEPEVKLHNNRTNEDVDISDSSKFTVSYENQDKVGTAKVTVKAAATNEYYTGTATAEYTIADAELGRIELKADSYVYTGSEIKDVVKAVYGTDEKELKNWTAVYSHNTDAGLASVVVTVVSGGKTLSLEKTFEITPAPIQNAVIGNLEETYEYTGDVVRPEVTVTVNGRTLVKNVDYQLMNTEETGLGEKGLAVHGINNYAGDILKHFTVVPASLKGAKVVVKNAVYNGKVRKPAVTVSVGGKRLKAANYTVTYDNTAKIGAKTATIEGKGNYTGTVTAAYKVTPAKAVISKVTAGTKKLTVAVKAQTGAKYQIFYRQKGTKKWSVVLSAKASKAITVKSGVKYQVRVRAYAVMDGAKSFGTLSTVKTSAKVK